MAGKFGPPAMIGDFDRSQTHKQRLYDAWHETIDSYMTAVNRYRAATPAFFNPLAPPAGQIAQASPEWSGMPNMLVAMNDGDVLAAARLAETPIRWGDQDPGHPKGIAYSMARDATTRQRLDLFYRPQDEYLEWSLEKDAAGIITAINFTCEGPEYWETIGNTDRALLETLYGEISGDKDIPAADLYFSKPVEMVDGGGNVSRTFAANDYNPWNKWNLKYAIHLTHDSNSLGAEVNLGRDASYLWGKDVLKTSDPDLICCAAYGEINRNSDPTIGAKVNALVRAGNSVSLRNPVGLYIKGLDTTAFSLDGNPVANIASWFVPIRPKPADVKDMILRARFAVPDGVMHGGKKLRVGDITVDGTAIATGGQVARYITMTLYGLAVAGAPHQQPKVCQLSPCPNKGHPDYIDGVDYGTPCPDTGAAAAALVKNLHATSKAGLGSGLQEAGLAAPTVRVARRTGTIVIP
ncbi:MAG: hypothetical protein QOI12_3696 [Alphaproteobacteria bacterium]|jgi:hypothetical protein|nr:hypothetical protein [Alphaproteobacteria bacterium]